MLFFIPVEVSYFVQHHLNHFHMTQYICLNIINIFYFVEDHIDTDNNA